MGRALLCLLALPLVGAAPAQVPSLADRQHSLAIARQEAARADQRAKQLLADAGRERDAAARAAAEERALSARVDASRARLAEAEQRSALIEQLLDDRRARLAAVQLPVTRLLAGLQSLAARPAIVSVVQPGSVDDLVHLRAVLSGAVPAVRDRAAGVRTELAEARRLRQDAASATRALDDSRAQLERDRTALAQAASRHRGRAEALGRDALTESDRALALGERARDIVDQLEQEGAGRATAAGLAALAGPTPRPAADMAPSAAAGVYRLPVAGRLVTGFGEMSDAGIRSRGLTFVVAPNDVVRAPASGVVRYARPFRAYGNIVIIDHGEGWTSLVTGLGSLAIGTGTTVAMGKPLGRARQGEEPRVTVELRRRGRPVDAAALVG